MPKVKRDPWGEINLKYLVYERGHSFVVFIDDENDLDWRVADEYIKANQAKFDECRGVIHAAANAETMPCDNLSENDMLMFKRQVGNAIALGLLCDPVHAEQAIASAREFNQMRNREVSRYWQLKYCGLFIALAVFLGLWSWLNRNLISPYMGKTFIVLVLAVAGGMAGAFFSIATRMATLGTESGSSLPLHIAESLTRIITGGISGVFGVVAVKSGLVLGNLTSNCGDIWNVLLVSLVAGLSERFVPSLIAKTGLSGDAASGSGPAQPPAPAPAPAPPAPEPTPEPAPEPSPEPAPAQPDPKPPQGGTA